MLDGTPDVEAILRDLPEDQFERWDAECAYLTGSLAVGLGNTASDVDLVCLVSREVPPWQEQFVDVGAQVCHVEFFQRATMERWIQEIERADLGLASYEGAIHRLRESRDLARFFSGRPIYGADRFEELRNRAHEQRLRCVLVQRALCTAITYVRDAAGAEDTGDYISAVESSGIALRWCLEGVVHAVSPFLFENDKWTLRRLHESLGSTETLRTIVEALYAGDGVLEEPARMSAWTRRRVNLVGQLSGILALYWWQNPAGRLPWHLVTSAVERTSWVCAAPFSDGIMLGGITAATVTKLDALVWLTWIRGTAPADLVSSVAHALPAGVSEQVIRTSTARLARFKLIDVRG